MLSHNYADQPWRLVNFIRLVEERGKGHWSSGGIRGREGYVVGQIKCSLTSEWPSYWTTFFLCKINLITINLLIRPTQKYISWFVLILPLFDSSLFLSNIASIICTSLCHLSFFSSTRLEWSNAWIVWRKACLADVRLFCAKKHLACL